MLVKGSKLTQEQRKEVLARFVHRFTGQHKPAWTTSADKPTHATDAEWIDDHSFYVKKDGSFDNRRRNCEPHFLAN